MPSRGRPSGGLFGRRNREREWEVYEADRDRFQELDSEDENERAGHGAFRGDRLHFTGFDLGTGKQAGYDDLVYDEDQEDEDYYDPGSTRQVQLRLKEDDVVEKAIRRIQRAKLRGESGVDLTREELDALERRQLLSQVVAPRPSRGQASRVPSGISRDGVKLRKRSGGLGRFAHDVAPPSRSTSDPARQQTSRLTSRPDRYDYQSTTPPAVQPRRPSRGSPTRSLPDEPGWIPHSRSSSSLRQTSNPIDQHHYQVPNRRNVSGPPGVLYPQPRRSPISPVNAVTRKALPRAISSELSLGQRGASGLNNVEVIEISSDDDEDESDDGESDESVVRVDLVPRVSRRGYGQGGRMGGPRR